MSRQGSGSDSDSNGHKVIHNAEQEDGPYATMIASAYDPDKSGTTDDTKGPSDTSRNKRDSAHHDQPEGRKIIRNAEHEDGPYARMIAHDDTSDQPANAPGGRGKGKVIVPDESDVSPYEHMIAHDDANEHPENQGSAQKDTGKGRQDTDRGRANAPNEGDKGNRGDTGQNRATRKDTGKDSGLDLDLDHEEGPYANMMSHGTDDTRSRNKETADGSGGDNNKEMKDILFAKEAEKEHGPSAQKTGADSSTGSSKDSGARESSKRRLSVDPTESAPNKSRST